MKVIYVYVGNSFLAHHLDEHDKGIIPLPHGTRISIKDYELLPQRVLKVTLFNGEQREYWNATFEIRTIPVTQLT